MTEYDNERFVFLIPVGPTDVGTLRARGFFVRAFREFLVRKYGGWTPGDAWGPAVVGQWLGLDGRPVTDESIVLWVDVEIARLGEALLDFDDWRLRFQRQLRQQLILVSHFRVRTLGPVRPDEVGQLSLFAT